MGTPRRGAANSPSGENAADCASSEKQTPHLEPVAGGQTQTPAGTGTPPCNLDDDTGECRDIEFVTTVPARKERAIEAGLTEELVSGGRVRASLVRVVLL